MDIISCAAVRHPKLNISHGRRYLAADEAALLTAKIRTVLTLARANGVQALVLSALGCGAFKNPPGHVAELFRAQLRGEFTGAFEEVVFAIFDDHNSRRAHNPEGNLLPFQRVFGSSVKR